MNRMLVIGATGNVGRQVVAQLASAGAEVRALVRDPFTAGLPANVQVMRGDLTQPESLDACLEGIDSVFLLWFAPPATLDVVMQRILGQARRIVFLSSPYKTDHPMFQRPQPNLVSKLHAEIERSIENSGREWTFLRPGMLAANARLWWAEQIRAGSSVVRWPCALATTAPIHERDIAAVAVRALLDDGHSGAEYLVTGAQALNHAEQVAMIGDVIGRPLRLEEAAPEEWLVRDWRGGPEFVGRMLLSSWLGATGQPVFMTSTVQDVTGNPPRSFRQWVEDNAAAFQPAT
jgi:uncharacterized protein YbjT (DUF2867 family)